MSKDWFPWPYWIGELLTRHDIDNLIMTGLSYVKSMDLISFVMGLLTSVPSFIILSRSLSGGLQKNARFSKFCAFNCYSMAGFLLGFMKIELGFLYHGAWNSTWVLNPDSLYPVPTEWILCILFCLLEPNRGALRLPSLAFMQWINLIIILASSDRGSSQTVKNKVICSLPWHKNAQWSKKICLRIGNYQPLGNLTWFFHQQTIKIKVFVVVSKPICRLILKHIARKIFRDFRLSVAFK